MKSLDSNEVEFKKLGSGEISNDQKTRTKTLFTIGGLLSGIFILAGEILI